MKKYTKIVSVLLLIMIGILFTGSIANAANFDISGNPTDGVTLDNGQQCDTSCIRNAARDVRTFIEANPERSAIAFFNANSSTQEAILYAYNNGGTPLYSYTLSQAQSKIASYLKTEFDGYLIYKDQAIVVTHGTAIIEDRIVVINTNLNYRFSDGRKGKITELSGVSQYKIGDGPWTHVVSSGGSAPTSATCTKNGSTWNITAVWNPVAGAINYKLRYLPNDSKDVTTYSTVTTYTLTGVLSSGTYNLAYAAYSINGWSNFSSTLPVTCTDTAALAPEVTTFTASPTSITPGQSSTLTWASTNADKCTVNGVDKAPISYMTVYPTATTTYTIVCSKGSVNSSTKAATITVDQVVSCQNLYWFDSNTRSCGQKQFCGTYMYPGLQTFSTQAQCTTALAQSNTTPEVTTFTASPTSITQGQSSTLTWTSTNADKCTINGVDKTPNSSMAVTLTTTTTYTIVCSKGGVNSPTKTATITVGSISASTNPYARLLSVATVNKLDTWVTTKIVSRATTLTPSNYSKFIDSVINALYKVKSNTPTSNKNKRYMINYLLFSLQQIQDGINDDDEFLDGLL